LAARLPVGWDPLKVLLPDHAPVPAQEVASLDAQANVDPWPLAMVLGLALKATVTVGCALTVTSADCAALPPAPLQVSVKVVVALREPVDCDPLTPLPPDQPPEAVQEAALAADQFSVALPPLVTALGPTLRLTLGAGALTLTVAD